MSNYKKLQAVLREIFEIDKADLDFGIYRIMNQKRDDVNQFIEKQLPKDIKEILSQTQSKDSVQLQQELSKLGTNLDSAGVVRESSPKYLELQKAIEASVDHIAMEQEIFSHLTAFFKRYYKEGDFISQRRYKKDVYAIPYEGEEVKLHWANADQYYIKTSEYLKDYAFVLPKGKKVTFQLKEASTEQNNNKAQADGERRFALYEEEPIEVDGNTLTINFTYELHKKSVKQDALIKHAYEIISSNIPVDFAEICASGSAPTEKNKNRTLLEKHLNDYVSRNTFDYFIHKDLGGFLRRELDFYIKNEILYIDDINTENPAFFTAQLSKIKAFKTVADKIITFLAQIEDFQKKLWLKKKFVIRTDYCITLDKIPAKYYEEIFNNEEQMQEWKSLFSIECSLNNSQLKINKETPISLDELTIDNLPLTIKYAVLDTKHFSEEFKDKLIAEFYNLDEEIDGLLLNSDNFQALSILEDKYQSKIGAAYIDPPYNTGSDGFIYKDGFKSASWNTFLSAVLIKANYLLSDESIFMISNDDNENSSLIKLLSLSNFNFKTNLIWNSDGHTDNQFEIKINHEYISLAQKTKKALYGNVIDPNTRSESNLWKNVAINSITKNGSANPFTEIELPVGFPVNDTIGMIEMNVPSKEFFTEIGSLNYFPRSTIKKYKVSFPIKYNSAQYSKNKLDDKLKVCAGWANLNKLRKFIENSCKPFQDDGGTMEFYLTSKGTIYYKKSKESTRNIVSVLQSFQTTEKMKYILEDMDIEFSYPKPVDLIEYLLKIGNSNIYLDFFAGSGTTGHAVININRVSDDKAKYILIELGNYFNEILIPRLQKVIYTDNWKNGKPQDTEGISQLFKYQVLESYEDTLNNLVLTQNNLGELGFEEDAQEEYLLQYMLDVESRDHLFNVEIFKNPFDYKLKVTENNELIPTKVDLVETFNYLIGLYVEHIQRTKDIKFVEGITREGLKTLVIWRNLETTTNKETEEVFRRLFESERTSEFQQIYINGDHNLNNFRTGEDQFKVKMIEETFFNKMFDVNYEL